jgi:hypothetical protein
MLVDIMGIALRCQVNAGCRYRRGMRADEVLAAGVQLLEPLMQRHGFAFGRLTSANSSGGWSASGEFRREDQAEARRLELHFRHSLGLVSYQIGDASLSHVDYMRCLDAHNQYPGFSDDPLDGFRHLLDDLERYGDDFLSGPGDDFLRCAEHPAAGKRSV